MADYKSKAPSKAPNAPNHRGDGKQGDDKKGDSKGGYGKKDDRKERPRRAPMPQLKLSKKVKLEFCHHIYCMGDGAKFAYKRAKNELEVDDKGVSKDGNVTIDKCGCLGHCGKGPNLKVTYTDDEKSDVFERMNAFRVGEMLKPYRRRKKK